MATTVVLVDDHDGFRREARHLLVAAGLEVVGEAATAGEAVEMAGRLRPDAVLLDVLLPDGNGFDVARQLDRSEHRPRVVLISSRRAPDFGDRLLQSPVDGFLSKADLTIDSLGEALIP